jgi:hypothetical protein
MKETEEFIELQKELLKYKKSYYISDVSLISDYEYDMLEKRSLEEAKKLGFRANKWLGPEENEAHHVHWMVGFNKDSVYLQELKKLKPMSIEEHQKTLEILEGKNHLIKHIEMNNQNLVPIDTIKDFDGIEMDTYYEFYKCPFCGDKRVIRQDRYCSGCGCEFKWS